MSSTRDLIFRLLCCRKRPDSKPTQGVAANQAADPNTAQKIKAVTAVESKDAPTSALVKLGISASFTIPINEIRRDDYLEDGLTAKVYKGTWRGMTVAIKHADYKAANGKALLKILRHESSMLQMLQQAAVPGVVKYIGTAHDPNIRSYNIVMEYLPKGDIYRMITTEYTSALICLNTLEKTAAALADFHAANFVHADLKWENVLRDEDDGVKLCDVAFSCKLEPGQEFKIGDMLQGTPSYLAPELITKNRYSYASDIFAFGSMIFTIATQQPLFPHLSPEAIQSHVASGNRSTIPSYCPAGLAKLIKHCWMQDHKARPTAKKLCEELHTLVEAEKQRANSF